MLFDEEILVHDTPVHQTPRSKGRVIDKNN